jgi:hypothetical protein
MHYHQSKEGRRAKLSKHYLMEKAICFLNKNVENRRKEAVRGLEMF